MSSEYPELQKYLVAADDWHTGWVLPWSTDTLAAIAEELRKARAEAWDEGYSIGWAAGFHDDDTGQGHNPYRADQIERGSDGRLV